MAGKRRVVPAKREVITALPCANVYWLVKSVKIRWDTLLFYTHCIGNLFSRWNITVAVRMTYRKTLDLRSFQSFVVKFSIICCQYSRCLQIHSAAMKPFYISHRLILLDQRGGEQTLGREIDLLAVIQDLMVIKMVLPLSACQKCRNVLAKMWRLRWDVLCKNVFVSVLKLSKCLKVYYLAIFFYETLIHSHGQQFTLLREQQSLYWSPSPLSVVEIIFLFPKFS